MAAYSMDYRERVAALYDEGHTTAEVVEQMGCSASWARRLKQRRCESGSLAPLTPHRPDQRTYDDQDEQRIREMIRKQPDLTLAEVAEAMGKPVCLGTVSRTLERMGLPRKKSPSMPPSRTGRT